MFSGIDCCREAWAFVESAAKELWGIAVGMQWSFMVESDKTCQQFLLGRYGTDRCLFPDALQLVSNGPSKSTRAWDPKQLQIVEESKCLSHDNCCGVSLDPSVSFGVLGAPCILFSRCLGVILCTVCVQPLRVCQM